MHSITCRNHHCPKCHAKAAKRWLEARQADLLPVEYYHVVFTLPAPIAAIAWDIKAVVYGLLFDIAAETMRTIAADPKHLGAQIGMTMVLHTWASGRLQFFGDYAALAEARAFNHWLAPLRKCEWVVYAKRPFVGPQAVLAYLSRYTHRVAISNQRLIALDERGVTFRWKDYRAKGSASVKTKTLAAAKFMRRFLLHVLPSGFHRIRHYGLLANAGRKKNLAHVRQLLHVPVEAGPAKEPKAETAKVTFVCPHCGAGMVITATLPRHYSIRAPPALRGAI